MASDHEPAKILLPYLQRADELQKHEPLVAYYCRLYAMDRGLKIPAGERTKTTNALLNSLIKQLEKDKKSLNLGPEDSLHLEGFALNVFAKADKQDRAGRADLNTAKTFYAASIFFEILNQFGPLQPDLEQKQKYAAWKAADIRKALKEGRKPVPGPPAGEDDLTVPSSTPGGSYDLGVNPAPEPDLSPQPHERIERQHSANISGSPPPHPTSSYPSNDFHAHHPPPNTKPGSPPLHSSSSYPSHDLHAPHPPNTQPESSTYSSYYQETSQQHIPQNYPSEQQHQSTGYSSEHFSQIPQIPHNYSSDHYNYLPQSQQHIPNNYPSQDNPPYSYPNFQSYPSFTESNLPSVPTHDPSYYQGPETSHIPSNKSFPSVPQYGSSSSSSKANGSVSSESVLAPTPAHTYQYDSNYQPPPEKIAEAHKAARFAVGALAFDDVSVAVDFLRKSLELLTKPSAGQ
ncbi:hypothetical protein CDL15_Pgr007363 [Punica granatum]|uniref:Protein HOMOLOG OF MAMMALIAN LYST-INTERACTING PROTEIN 5 n=1 Tax=Punica granatum TaxID=22663 RepID=A0A218X7Z7_PUNGR|nr:hypothetical protein CDL15_Pgr007363 [Punica granatum]